MIAVNRLLIGYSISAILCSRPTRSRSPQLYVNREGETPLPPDYLIIGSNFHPSALAFTGMAIPGNGQWHPSYRIRRLLYFTDLSQPFGGLASQAAGSGV